ncbi:hypothetical protein BBP40_012543 [Aspergillus hancockii]|nr:hypothetical protein BBP40_012543 [Aspergillus hancockii]
MFKNDPLAPISDYFKSAVLPGAGLGLEGEQLVVAKKKASVAGYDKQSLVLTIKHFTPRLIATKGGWFANDVFFYGNKLFQGTSYYCAGWFVDNKLYGRKWMQIIGFLVCFNMFAITVFAFKYYQEPAHIHPFKAMYFISFYFNQFGPCCITFLVAAEVFPTPIRATARGISAAAGTLITWLFLPDTTGLDLREQECRWKYIREGREHEYHGPAVHPRHLSVWERLMGKGKSYDPDLDYQIKVKEFRTVWETIMADRAA